MTDPHSQQMTTALRHALIDLKASRTLVQHTMGEPHGLNQTIAMVEAALGGPEEITGAEMDAIEAAAIAGKPLQPMDIWQRYAAAQDEIAALKAANASGDVRAAVIAECVTVIGNLRQSGAGLFDAKHSGQRGQDRSDALYDAYQALRALQPATPATGGQHG